MLESAANGTVFSFDNEPPAVPAADVAGSPDALDPGTAIRGALRNACAVRRLTSAGAVIHADFELAPGEKLQLELENGQRLEGSVAWQNGGETGLTFDRPVDVFAIIARNMVNMPGERRRLPRIQVRCGVHLDAPSGTELAAALDISQGGLKLETRLALSPGDPVQVTPEGLFPLPGTVRWSKGGLAGIAFNPERGWQELMPWLKGMRDLAQRRAERPVQAAAPVETRHPAMARLDEREGEIHLNIPARVREGTTRWNIEVRALTQRAVEFESYAPIALGAFLWVVLPGLEGWPGRIVRIEGNRFTCAFTQLLHAAVFERILEAAKASGGGAAANPLGRA
jgi:hypothetical protein